MGKCFSFTSSRDKCYRWSFSSAGLRSLTANLGDGTFIHSWGPKAHKPNKPTLVLLHGIGANAMWQWGDFVSPLSTKFNGRMSVVGLSYGGFVAYSMAALFPEAVERVVIGCAGTPEKLRELMRLSFYKPAKNVPSCFLADFIHGDVTKNVPFCFLADFNHVGLHFDSCVSCWIWMFALLDLVEGAFSWCFVAGFVIALDVMCTENLQERKELIYALHKDRKLSDLPKITQPTLIIWGEHDQVFPIELAHRLVRHLGNNAELVLLKNAGHAINMEKTKELYKHLKSFLTRKLENNGKSSKVE
ncbi:hypothetical protein SASPL_156815 [Salvia splendens]|uniref:AB hydrolase-1 domain-containing protein n=1 Tax=Salvia splendens TaxID=180675 RepID=A0A8X8YXC9_SALSN|nr:hypothetical protein SASPL_156815 [Salvia splendens]